MAKKRKAKRKTVSKNPWWWKFIISRARQVTRWDPVNKQVLEEARGYCATCKKQFEYLEVDHIEPVVPVDKPFGGDFNTYFDRMFNGKRQALCERDHRNKCDRENAARKVFRDSKKITHDKS